ncbi:alpha/beta fold hydrolase [Chitinophaga polysaccharea]|uniref:alpha/beta hydrolase family protein n=1 Tax=Chitinophaga TaxID=79328 RepID=UPI001455778C|nr:MULTISPECIES: alpha/beta fold hydrolase [Chitinophaga]NLR61912.1 alpha/beta fold hydrolase [Chitinophaga polysaccharea]NLU94461.1 alpha/beta fold hydrolase [Chitinophaga sp. Ak27]
MKTQSFKLSVSPSIGTVSAKYIAPDKPTCVFTLAHGAGAGMDHSFMETLAHALAEAGIATLRFNFPFAEGKKGRPDSPAVAHETIAAAIAKAQELHPKLPLFAAGKSFGGRMSSQYLAMHPESVVKGIVFYGFPLHPSGKPGTERAEHLKALKIPMLFLQGSKDTLATWELIETVCRSLRKATLVKLEGADHSFKAGKKDVMSLLVSETKQWVEKVLR